MSLNMAVLGGGRLAVRLLQLFARTPVAVKAWSRSERARTVLAEVKAPNAEICDSLEEACTDANIVFMAVPADALLDLSEQYGPHARGDHVVLHGCRGVGPGFQLPHQAIRAATCVRKIGVLGGPLYFADVAKGRALVVALASRYDEVFDAVRVLVDGTPVRLQTGSDVIGVEVAGAISNVTAIAAGICEELGLGETARGLLLTRGLSEAARLGVRLGGESSTFSGLAGVGDLIPRDVSSTRRHHDLGALLARGVKTDQAVRGMEGTVEGVLTAREAAAASRRLKVKLPLVNAVADILDGRAEPRPTLESILDMGLELEALHARP